MTKTFYIEVPLNETTTADIEVVVTATIKESAAGKFEFLSNPSADDLDYVDIEATEWDSSGFTDAEIEIIEAVIRDNHKKWAESIMESYAPFEYAVDDNDDDYEDEDDRENYYPFDEIV